MAQLSAELLSLVDEYTDAFNQISETTWINKPTIKWSKKEILGHLVDSAQSNSRRFVVAQYEESPYIVYDQDKWVSLTNYQQYDTKALISFWALMNKHIAHVWKNMPAGNEKRICRTQDLHSIEWLASDYILHLKHHVHQILDREPIPYS